MEKYSLCYYIFQYLLEWLFQKSPSEATSAMKSFSTTIEPLNQTRTLMALYQCRKFVRNSQKKRFIPVQCTAYARRKQLAHGRQVSRVGRPRSVNRKHDLFKKIKMQN